MRFEWDEDKNNRNLAKHGLSFETASLVFLDPNALSLPDSAHIDQEERWHTIGQIENVLVVLVVHTFKLEGEQEEVIRLISARKATRAERQAYEETLW